MGRSPRASEGPGEPAGVGRGRRGRAWPLLAAGLAAALAASAGLNVALYRLALTSYRAQQAVQLDPTGAAQRGPAEAEAEAVGGGPRIVYVGDSRIAQWPSPPGAPGCTVLKRGISGQTTAQVLLRLDRDVPGPGPRVAVVQAGVNDLKALGALPGREREIVAGCRSNLRQIVAKLRARGAHVVVLTIWPVGRPALARWPVWSEATRAAIDDVNRALRDLAGPGVTVVDCDPILRRGDRIAPAFARDTLHLSPAGYEAMTAALRPVLRGIVGGAEEARTSHAVQ